MDVDHKALPRLVLWARTKGVELTGVEPQRIPGKGTGMFATRAVKADENILTIPISAIRTRDSVPLEISKHFPKAMSVHGILAAQLAMDAWCRENRRAQGGPPSLNPWAKVMPSREDVWTSMPLAWDTRLEEFLPQPARELLQSQIANFGRDWSDFEDGLAAMEAARKQQEGSPNGDSKGEANADEGAATPPPSISSETYMYHWLLVNTRTFYYAIPGTESRVRKEDRLCLQPVADMFNHASEVGPDASELTVEYDLLQDGDDAFSHETNDTDKNKTNTASATAAAATVRDKTSSRSCKPSRFVFRTRRTYAPGDEVCLSYGLHSNDFLLAEYGFVPAENARDEVCIDDVVLPALLKAEAARTPRGGSARPPLLEQLDDADFLGRYMLDADTPRGCYRTQVALRAMLGRKTSDGDDGDDGWRLFVKAGGHEPGFEEEQRRVDAALAQLLRAYGEEINGKLELLGKAVDVGEPSQREMLAVRWRQIQDRVERSVKWLEGQGQ